MRPKEYTTFTHPVPMDVPRIRYELLTRQVGHSAPVANAGPPQIGVPPGTITLNGSGSYSPDHDALNYSWNQVSGPTVALIRRQCGPPPRSPRRLHQLLASR
jgi:hypothetical protein